MLFKCKLLSRLLLSPLLGSPRASQASRNIPPQPLASRPAAHHHLHLLNLAWLLHGQAQQLVRCNLHEERVENPNLPGVDVPDEGRLLPEALSHLRAQDCKGEMRVCAALLLESSQVVLSWRMGST